MATAIVVGGGTRGGSIRGDFDSNKTTQQYESNKETSPGASRRRRREKTASRMIERQRKLQHVLC